MHTQDIYNPTTISQKFLRKANGRTYHFGADGILYGEGGSPAMQVQIGEEWEVAREAVDFMTAANSGKRFRPESWIWSTDDYFRNLYDNLNAFSGRKKVQEQILNGKWYIE